MENRNATPIVEKVMEILKELDPSIGAFIKEDLNKLITTSRKLRVWWMPQVGTDTPVHHIEVRNEKEAARIIDVLANYDLFQIDNKIKPDYANMGGVEVFEDGNWCNWCDDVYDDFDEYTDEVL